MPPSMCHGPLEGCGEMKVHNVQDSRLTPITYDTINENFLFFCNKFAQAFK